MILLLVLTNMCLLGLAVRQSIRSGRLDSQARENGILFLRERGVEVEDAVVPQHVSLTPQVAERELTAEAEAAAALLQGKVTAEARGGEVYRYYNDNGAVQFHSDGTFSAQLRPGLYPAGEDRTAACQRALECLGFQSQLLEEDREELIFRQIWEGTPLFSNQVTVTCHQGSVVGMAAGRRLVGTPRQDTTRQTITVATALVDFLNGVSTLGDVCSRVDAIEQGYVTTASLSGTVTLTPVWRVTTDTGAYLVDTVTAAVSRADQTAVRSVDGGA